MLGKALEKKKSTFQINDRSLIKNLRNEVHWTIKFSVRRADEYSQPSQTSKSEPFAKIVNGFTLGKTFLSWIYRMQMYSGFVSSTVYNQKGHFLLVGSGTTTTYSPSNTKFYLNYFNIFQHHIAMQKIQIIIKKPEQSLIW